MNVTYSPRPSFGTAGVVSGLVRLGFLGPLTLMTRMHSLPSRRMAVETTGSAWMQSAAGCRVVALVLQALCAALAAWSK